jgi:hypothetical protein
VVGGRWGKCRLLPTAFLLLLLDQNKVRMVNATVHVAGDSDETPLGIQDFQQSSNG